MRGYVMKRIVCLAGFVLLAAFAPENKPQPAKAAVDAEAQAANPQPASTQRSASTTPSSTSSTTMPEMKTQNYKGTLVDASCASSGAAAPAASSRSEAAPKGEASRS